MANIRRLVPALLVLAMSVAAPAAADPGILLLAHGGSAGWLASLMAATDLESLVRDSESWIRLKATRAAARLTVVGLASAVGINCRIASLND